MNFPNFPSESLTKRLMQPIWDHVTRELRLGDKVVKTFRWPAPNQERILVTFQEEGWPEHIDDPMIPDSKTCPKVRLHDTLKCLNRNQDLPLIKFRGDGTGMGVRLEINQPDPDESSE